MQRMSMEYQQQTRGLPEAAVISTDLAQDQVSQPSTMIPTPNEAPWTPAGLLGRGS